LKSERCSMTRAYFCKIKHIQGIFRSVQHPYTNKDIIIYAATQPN
jgi:hypothetical protein